MKTAGNKRKREIRQIATTAMAAILVMANTQTAAAYEYDVFEYAESIVDTNISNGDITVATATANTSYDETSKSTTTYTSDDADTFNTQGNGIGTVAFAAGGYVLSEDASGIDVTKDETTGVCTVSITESGSYTLTGNTSNTVISIKKELEGGVSLTLVGLNIDNSTLYEAAGADLSTIECGKSTDLNIILEGSNLITAPSSGEEAEAVISQKKDAVLVFSGVGSLEITGSRDDAIKSKGDIKIEGGDITISDCHGDGIQGENVEISDGDLSITTVYEHAATSFYTDGSSSETLNTITENGNTKTEHVSVDTGSHKGIKAGTKAKTEVFTDTIVETVASGGLVITGGNITIDTTGSGLKANGIQGGDYTRTSTGVYIIGSPDDAIQSNNDLSISGGTITIRSSDDGISAAGNLAIDGSAVIDVETAYEGLEGADITIGSANDTGTGPVITINSNDDGINTSGKTSTYTYTCSSDEDADGYNTDYDYTKATVSTTSGNDVTIYSGTITIRIDSSNTDNDNSVTLTDGDTVKTISYTSSGDGIDCNGALDIEGGSVTVFGQSAGDNSPIDTNDGFTLAKAATVLVTGSDGMGESTPGKGDGAYIVYGQGGTMGRMMTPPDMGNGQTGQMMTPPDMNNDQNTSQSSSQYGRPMAPPDMNNDQNTSQSSSQNVRPMAPPDMSNDQSDSQSSQNGRPMAPPDMSNDQSDSQSSQNGSPMAPPDMSNDQSGQMTTPPGMNDFQSAQVSASSVFKVTSGEDVLVNTTLPYQASFILYASPALTENSAYEVTIGDNTSTLTAMAPGTGITNGSQNAQMLPPGMNGEQNGQMMTPPGMNGDQNGQMMTPPGMNGDQNGQMMTPPGMNGEQNGQNGQTTPPQDPAAQIQPEQIPANDTKATTSTETQTFVTIDGQDNAVSASVTYDKSITYTGSKITAKKLEATPDISSLTGAVQIRNDGYTADDLFTVKYIAKNNKNVGADSYFYAKIVFSNSKAKKAGLTAAERKSVKAAVKALNSELKEKKCSFTIEPVDITAGTAEVSVKKLNSDGSLKTKADGTLSSIKSVIYTGTDGSIFKLGSKRCTVTVVNAETGEVQITGNGNFTGTLTAYVKK